MFGRKYLGVAKLGLQENLEYRFNFFTTFIFVLAPLAVHISLWIAVYATGVRTIAGYSFEMMMTYTILGHLLEKFTGEVNIQIKTSADIREGLISRYLVKPIDYFTSEIAILFSNRIIYFVTLIIPYLLVILATRKYFMFNSDPILLLLFVISIFMAIILSFLLNHLLGLLTFWLKEINSLYVFTQSTFSFFAGGYFTLNFLPQGVYDVLMYLPLPYTLFFPTTIYLKKYTLSQIGWHMLIAAAWIVLLFIINKIVWRRGIRRYTSDGI